MAEKNTLLVLGRKGKSGKWKAKREQNRAARKAGCKRKICPR